MIRHYLNLAWRHLHRRKGYAALNIIGLAVGMACCLLIALFIFDELSYEKFHSRRDRIYRLTIDYAATGTPTNANTSWPYGPEFQSRMPEIEKFVRFRRTGWDERRVVAYEGKRFYESRLLFADSTVFDVFDFPLILGQKSALMSPQSIVLTESTARKYFGKEYPLGKVLSIDIANKGSFIDFTVTGVVADVPSNSHIDFDFLASFSSQTDMRDRWGMEEVYTYFLVSPGADTAQMSAQLRAMAIERLGNPPDFSFGLQALNDIHFGPRLNGEFKAIGNLAYVYSFGTIAVIILLLACINFTNLATARFMGRTSEIGVRKVMGAQRRQLAMQFLGEAALVAVSAVAVALILAELALPLLNSIGDKNLSLIHPPNLWIIPAVVVGVLLVGTASGVYPALHIAALSPVAGLRRKRIGASRSGIMLRRTLVVVQFSAAVALIIAALVVYQQIRLIRSADLGFARDQIIVMPINEQLRTQFDAFKQRIAADPSVINVTASEQVPGRAGNGSGYLIEGFPEPFDLTRFFIDPEFLNTYGVELIAGTSIPADHQGQAPEMLITKSILTEVGIPDAQSAIGRKIKFRYNNIFYDGYIAGVTADFHLFSLHEMTVGFVMTSMPPSFFNFVSVRVNGADIPDALSHLRNVWSSLSPSYPFDYYFLDDDFDRIHRADLQFGTVVSWFTGLAIMVAALGLVGLATYAAQQRRREISIRKVLGATVPNLVALLSSEFILLVAIANAVGLPLAYVAVNRWLQNFAYRVDLSVWVFIVAGLLTLLLALISTGVQTVRAALVNPSDTLRYE